MHYGRRHDYVYYPVAWTVGEKRYEAGYYDEEGNHYDSVAIKNEETICKCPYCDSLVKIKWDGGTLPPCERCGAPLDIKVTDEGQDAAGSGSRAVPGANSANHSKTGGLVWLTIVIFVVLALISTLISIVRGIVEDISGYSQYAYEEDWGGSDDWDNAFELPATYYAAPIGRVCALDEYDNYYDEQTQCWFFYNQSVDPPVWQYWYEGISSDYGDYGWMEYDPQDASWYIQNENGDWKLLPSKYNTAALWHFDDPNAFIVDGEQW